MFNHAITYVPELDLFLDGTAGFSGAYELPSGDQGASILVIEDGRGGTFGLSPVLPASASVDERHYDVDLRAESARGHIHFSLSGTYAASARVLGESAHGREEWIESELSSVATGIRIEALTVAGADQLGDEVTIDVEFEGGGWTNRDSGRLTVFPGGRWSNYTARLAGQGARESTLDLSFARTARTRVTYTLPSGVTPERVPEPTVIDSRFGRFTMESELQGDVLETTVEFSLDVLRVEPSEYREFREYLQAVDAALSAPVTLVEGSR